MAIASFLNHGGGTLLIFAAIFSLYVADVKGHANKTCIPAEAEPSLESSSCYPLVNFTRPFCQNYGITLPSYVYRTPADQIWNNDLGNTNARSFEKVRASRVSRFLNISVATYGKCLRALFTYYCHRRFPSCDRTQNVVVEQKVCRESCLEMIHICGKIYDVLFKYSEIRFPKRKKRYRCELQPYRNAGDSPECYYYSLEKEDCLYLNGSSYHGNVFMTTSGIPCQSWTEQCPHRHTMNTTYPELNDAKNYCRNPQNSGQRPWCFTTDRKKRWEYCDIPKCIPVNGSYGNWSLNTTCTVTCGKGLERWSRECNNPKPKYGGRNCSHLGDPVEYRPCTKKPCVVNGGYSGWYLSNKCNVTCGNGVEVWRRSCDNPSPKNGGQNCSVLGNDVEYRICKKQLCPIDGNYGNWTKLFECSVTCGVGYELWQRKCDSPPPKHGGDCFKYGKDRESRVCRRKPCLGTSSFDKLVKIVCGVCASIFIIVIGVLIYKRKALVARFKKKDSISPYAFCVFTEIPVNYSCIDGTTREHLPIAESVCETNRLTTEEPIYEIIP